MLGNAERAMETSCKHTDMSRSKLEVTITEDLVRATRLMSHQLRQIVKGKCAVEDDMTYSRRSTTQFGCNECTEMCRTGDVPRPLVPDARPALSVACSELSSVNLGKSLSRDLCPTSSARFSCRIVCALAGCG